MTCRLRYKIQRKVREHNRKKRKEQRKKEKTKSGGGGLGIKKLEHVPNSCPFKQELLEQAERSKREEEKRREILKAQLRKEKHSQKDLEALVGSAQSRQKRFDDLQQKSANDLIIESLSKPVEDFTVALRRVVKLSDILLEILDARDPLGSRSAQVENMILEAGKRLVLVMNKIDLIPKENIKKWLNYLRREYPAVAFKASTQEQRKKLGWISGANVITSKAIGADILLRLLGSYVKNKEAAGVIRIGIVGNLKRKIICDVGANPGVTRTVQEVQLDQKIRLIDSPGVIMAKDGSMDATELALKNFIRTDKADCQTAVQAISSMFQLMLLYNLPDFNDVDEFLTLLAKSTGRLRKGGIPDRRMAARKLKHMGPNPSSGKIRYYCEPPDDRSGIVCSEVVDQMMKEFDLDAISEEESLVLQSLPSSAIAEAVIMGDDALAPPGNACDQLTKVDLSSQSKGRKRPNDYDDVKSSLETEGNRQDNRFLKHMAKRRKRQMRKTENRCSRLADAMETAMKLADSPDNLAAYNFDGALEMAE
ncbi:GN3L Grn1 domain containing protein [Trichuris trichiura]|uniref:GN3L Grn1 domain containing protein n=1 Tax=Trichuris trichiura TaxID=36087 RepID=A0A077Z428_TRITR|nr:GN3L Grn1 domain containing protein [Trichuris trichiura]